MKHSQVFAGVLFAFSLAALPAFSKTPSTFYTVGWKDGKAWFLTPAGKTFLSLGINHIGDGSFDEPSFLSSPEVLYNPLKNQFAGDKQAWMQSVLARLKKWHFNTIGAWSYEPLYRKNFPYTYITYVGRGPKRDAVLESVFSPEFETVASQNAQKIAGFKDDPSLIGYFLDNEMGWWGEFGWPTDGQKSLLEKYAAGGVENLNKKALVAFFQERYTGDIGKMNGVWGTSLKSFEDLNGPVSLSAVTRAQKADAGAWAGKVAERYFKVTVSALRAVDPNHLILGARFAGETPWAVVEACAKYCDVVSVNHYQKNGDINKVFLDNIYAKTKKPVLLTEYSFRAMENQSGNPNTKGADVTVPTQAERVEHTERFTKQLLELPYLVGMHWFEWADEPPKGRFDGEDSNYGLVDIHDREYTLLTQAHASLNSKAPLLHQSSTVPLPGDFQETIPKYREAKTGTQVASSRDYLKMEKPLAPWAWSDKGNGGQITPEAVSGNLVLNYESGTGWGCGISYPPNVGPFVKENVVDVTGYNFFEFKAFVPKGLKFAVYVAESGTNDPAFKGVNGADGEAYGFPVLQGTGKWDTYRVNLEDLEHRTSYGNQGGNNLLDLQGLADVEFYIPGKQGAGKMLVKDLEFKVK